MRGNQSDRYGADSGRIPLWMKCGYTALAIVVVIIYWQDLGPSNFLWFSDIALIVMVAALWMESRLLSSVMAVGVLALELGWVADFVTGGRLLGITAYLFEAGEHPSFRARLLSAAFHLALPIVILFALSRLGYDRRGFWGQSALAVLTLPVTFLITDPSQNINWVYGPVEPQEVLPPWLYLASLAAFLILAIYLPSHFVLKRMFSEARKGQT